MLIERGQALLLSDRFAWPQSAEARIEEMAEILRRIEGPARWCYASEHSGNLASGHKAELGRCFSRLAPASDFIEMYPRDYIKRFYRAREGTLFCEATLSTVWNDDRIVGADCYYGLFQRDDGVGMTDDPFG
ncbi:hypothetical protein [Vannielia sp.]|uniref:hypothetical protein n=1 Tax=Vannielia sp. TaxID=2813045 RepID=UPI002607812E|nr:hypothetical protein [Vannielia sp.]MDF1871894.1 hypothetical protein [Vannielia sp.]